MQICKFFIRCCNSINANIQNNGVAPHSISFPSTPSSRLVNNGSQSNNRYQRRMRGGKLRNHSKNVSISNGDNKGSGLKGEISMQQCDVQELSTLIEKAIQSKMGGMNKRQRILERMEQQKVLKEQEEFNKIKREQKRNIFKYAQIMKDDQNEIRRDQKELSPEELERKFGFKNLNKDEYKFNKSENRNKKMIQKLESYYQ